MTRSGIACQPWANQTPHSHTEYNALVNDFNYCRNPNPDSIYYHPWCLTMDPKKKWDFCDVPPCGNFYLKYCTTEIKLPFFTVMLIFLKFLYFVLWDTNKIISKYVKHLWISTLHFFFIWAYELHSVIVCIASNLPLQLSTRIFKPYVNEEQLYIVLRWRLYNEYNHICVYKKKPQILVTWMFHTPFR